MNAPAPYPRLVESLKRLGHLGSVQSVLSWDEQVNLPPESAEFRGRQSAYLSDLLHREFTDPELGEQIAAAEAIAEELDPPSQAVVREARKNFDLDAKLTGDFIQRRSIAQSRAFHAWVSARKESNFEAFAPLLQEQLDLSLEMAELCGRTDDPYDFFVDQFDPGMDSATIDSLFGALRSELLPIVDSIVNSGVKPRDKELVGFDIAKQEIFLREVVEKLGFNFGKGRLDRSVHPFCGGSGQDTRMTTRFLEDLPLSSLFGSIHETGHGLYEQGLPVEHFGTALGDHIGMAVHESQSRMWENQIGRSRAFWSLWEPRYRELFGEELKAFDSDALYLAINAVGVSPIRVESDEVTYNLHIMLRFSIERRLFNGELAVKDLPDAWAALSEDLLNYTPKNHAEGVLQDVHWSGGMFGYFPSYCLGNILAAQIWYTVKEEIPDLEDQFAAGNFQSILDWMRNHVHSLGKQFYTQDLAEKVTGKRLHIDPLIRYLKERYLPLYQ